MTKQETLTRAKAFAKAAQEYANTLQLEIYNETYAKEPILTSCTSSALFELANAAIDLVDDGDFLAARQAIMDDMRWDDKGYPVDEFGQRNGAHQFTAPWEIGA